MSALLHAMLDAAGVDRCNRAESKAAAVVYSVAERVACLIVDRDHAREQLRLLRESHMATVRRAADLQVANTLLVGGAP